MSDSPSVLEISCWDMGGDTLFEVLRQWAGEFAYNQDSAAEAMIMLNKIHTYVRDACGDHSRAWE